MACAPFVFKKEESQGIVQGWVKFPKALRACFQEARSALMNLGAFAYDASGASKGFSKASKVPRKKKWSTEALWCLLDDDAVRLILENTNEKLCARLQRLDRNTHRVARLVLKKRLGLGDSQWQTFRAVVERGESIFLSGAPGTGKTHLLRTITDRLDAASVMVTASTGAAAEKIGAQTLHSAFCLGIDGIDVQKSIAACKKTRWKLFKMKTLIIDEVSMLTSEVLDAVHTIVNAVCARDRVQFVLSGDPLQLGEVDPSRECGTRRPFWESELLSWGVTKPYVLVEQFRQEDESHFARVLSRVRVGKASEADVLWLLANSRKPVEATLTRQPNGTTETPNDRVRRRWRQEVQPESVCLFCVRKFVDDFNDGCLNALPGLGRMYVAICHSNCLLRAPSLLLKVGARVMLTRNLPQHEKLHNGSCGTVIAMNADSVRVRFDTAGVRSICRVATKHGTREVSQLPLQIAWAATIHKAQGATLDSACVDMTRLFAKAQAYVALSRVRNVKDMEIIGLDLKKLNNVDKAALSFYNKMKAASELQVLVYEQAEAKRFAHTEPSDQAMVAMLERFEKSNP